MARTEKAAGGRALVEGVPEPDEGRSWKASGGSRDRGRPRLAGQTRGARGVPQVGEDGGRAGTVPSRNPKGPGAATNSTCGGCVCGDGGLGGRGRAPAQLPPAPARPNISPAPAAAPAQARGARVSASAAAAGASRGRCFSEGARGLGSEAAACPTPGPSAALLPRTPPGPRAGARSSWGFSKLRR